MSAASSPAISCFSDFSTTGDGLIAALQVLAVLARGRQAGQRSGASVRAAAAGAGECALQERLAAGRCAREIAHRGGEARLNGTGRVLVRKSGTEPVIRVMAEGEDEKAGRAVVRDIAGAIDDAARLKPHGFFVIAGSDSGGGAGHPGRHQNRERLRRLCHDGGHGRHRAEHAKVFMPFIRSRRISCAAQIAACLADIGADAIKIGMLGMAPSPRRWPMRWKSTMRFPLCSIR